LTGVWVAPARSGDAEHDALRAERREILRTETEQLEAQASQADAQAAEAIRALIEPIPPVQGPHRFVPLPEIVPESETATGLASLPEAVASIREEAADALFDLASRALEADWLRLADACLRDVIARAPNQPEARRLLGYIPYEAGWATPFAVSQFRAGLIRDPKFGWVPEEWVPELEAGNLPARGSVASGRVRWIPAEEANRQRRGRIHDGWQIETHHFSIRTTATLDEGIAFGQRLEAFFDLFSSVMADVIGPSRHSLAELASRPDATAPTLPARRHRVFYFASEDAYDDHMAPRLGPEITESLGVYIDAALARRLRERPASYFFKNLGGRLADEATLYHEASHQLLFELRGPARYERNVGHFWVFEGLGTYFETVESQPDGSLRFGGPTGLRFAEAQVRILDRREFLPIDRLARLDRKDFLNGGGTRDPRLLYAESMALTIFLMDAEHGRHRDGFFDYVGDAYDGRLRTNPRALSDAVALEPEELARRFKSFLEETRPAARTDKGSDDP